MKNPDTTTKEPIAILQEPMSNYGRLKNYVDGEWVDSRSTQTRQVVNPATAEVIAEVPLSTREEVEETIRVAQDAFLEWRKVPPVVRARYFFKLKELLEKHFEDLARIIVQENGKTIGEARGEMRRTIEEVECGCGIPSLMQGYNGEDMAPGIDYKVVLEPMGVFCMVSPFNFPAMIPMVYLPYAVACGNTYIVKPTSDTPISQNRIFELIDEAGFPPGVVNLVNGNREAVNVLLEHPDIKGLSFVGSTPVGELLYKKASQHHKRAQICGGAKNYLLVMPDADLDRTVAAMKSSFFGCAGQRCFAGTVALTVGDVYEPLKEKFLATASQIEMGYGLDPETQLGPVVTEKQKESVLGYIEKGIEEGAKLLLDGRNAHVKDYPKGCFVAPTIFDRVTPDMVIAQEEIFGPVACLMRAESFDEAIEIINGCRFGHAAMIFTSSGKWAREFQYRVEAGNIGINVGLAFPLAFLTLGGLKESFWGDLHGRSESILFFTERRVVVERWF